MGSCMGLFPASLGVLLIVSIITTYVIALVRNDVDALFPYISDTGVEIPERCIFSEFFNVAAFFGIVTLLLRHSMIKEMTREANTVINRLNNIAVVLAAFSCFGLTLVGNFQEDKIEYIHLAGAFMVFGLGLLYAFVDTCISYKMCPRYNGIRICRLRLGISLISFACFVTTLTAGIISREMWANSEHTLEPGHSRRHWKPHDPGYVSHLVSTFGEWGMALFFVFYFFTFIPDFQKMRAGIVVDMQVSHLDMDPVMIDQREAGRQAPSAPHHGGFEQPHERTGLLS